MRTISIPRDFKAVQRGDAFIGRAPVGTYHGAVIEPITGSTIADGYVINVQKYVTDWPFKFGKITSGDHSGVGGGNLWVSNNPTTGWVSYDDARPDFATVYGSGNIPAANPVITNPNASDDGEYFGGYWNPTDSKFYVLGHSASYETGQSQFYTSTSDFLNFTFGGLAHDVPGAGTGGGSTHSGYVAYSPFGGRYVGMGLRTGVAPLSYQQVWSADGINWLFDSRRIFGREPALWGIRDKELNRSVIFMFDGRPWQIMAYRTIPGAGGATTAGTLCAAPLSNDLRRLIGPPIVLTAKGGSGTDHEIATAQGFETILLDDDGTIYVYHQIEDSGGTRRIGCTSIKPATARNYSEAAATPSQALTVQSGYEALAGAWDAEGYLLPASPMPKRTHVDYNFTRITATPSDATETSATGSGTFTYSGPNSTRGELQIVVPNTANADIRYLAGAQFDFDYVSEAWLHVDGIKFTAQTGSIIDIGFHNESNIAGFAVQWQNLSGAINSSNNRGRFYVYNGSTTAQESTINYWSPFFDERYQYASRISVGVVRRLAADKTLKTYMIVMEGDQVVDCLDITANYSGYSVRPMIRGIRSSAGQTIKIGAIRVELAEAWEGS